MNIQNYQLCQLYQLYQLCQLYQPLSELQRYRVLRVLTHTWACCSSSKWLWFPTVPGPDCVPWLWPGQRESSRRPLPNPSCGQGTKSPRSCGVFEAHHRFGPFLYCLVVWNMTGWFFHKLGIVTPTDFHSIIFQRGWLKPPTSICFYSTHLIFCQICESPQRYPP